MRIKIQDTKQLGAIAKHVRQSQSLDQETAGLLSGNGLTFISQFEKLCFMLLVYRIAEI